MYVSYETIYKALFIQARGALEKEQVAYLRSHRAIRRSKYTSIGDRSGSRFGMRSRSERRPAEAEDRAVPGHWETTPRSA